MPAPIPMAIRQSVTERHKKGESISSLARSFKISRGSVHAFIKRGASEGADGLHTKYGNCGKARTSEDDFIFRAVRCLRAWHPSWGAEKIRAEVHRKRPGSELPHYRTFTRWFHWNGQIEPRLKTNLPKTKPKRAKRLHEGWQVDAKEEMAIADGSRHCWLNITDEYSGTVIDPPVFPQKEDQRGPRPGNPAGADLGF